MQSGMQCGQFSIYVFKRFAPSTSWQQLPPASSCIFASSCFPCTSGRKVRYLLYLLLEPGCHKASFKEAHGLPPHSIQQKSTGSGARAGFNPCLSSLLPEANSWERMQIGVAGGGKPKPSVAVPWHEVKA